MDLDAATVSIKRSAGMVRNAGEGAWMVEGATKSGKPRVVDLDPATVAVLRAYRKARGELHLSHARPDALVFGDIEGSHRNAEHVSRQFIGDVARHNKTASGKPRTCSRGSSRRRPGHEKCHASAIPASSSELQAADLHKPCVRGGT